MSGFLDRLAAHAQGRAPVVTARPPSRFEGATPDAAFVVDEVGLPQPLAPGAPERALADPPALAPSAAGSATLPAPALPPAAASTGARAAPPAPPAEPAASAAPPDPAAAPPAPAEPPRRTTEPATRPPSDDLGPPTWQRAPDTGTPPAGTPPPAPGSGSGALPSPPRPAAPSAPTLRPRTSARTSATATPAPPARPARRPTSGSTSRPRSDTPLPEARPTSPRAAVRPVEMPTADRLLADHIRPVLTEAGVVGPADGPGAVRFVDDPRPALAAAAEPPRTAKDTRPLQVHVHLGRVEVVHAPTPAAERTPPAPTARPARRRSTGPDHDAYLARRRDGR